MGRRRLATLILDKEQHPGDQIPLLLRMNEEEVRVIAFIVLTKRSLSGDLTPLLLRMNEKEELSIYVKDRLIKS
jgi:hypothetical protein